MDRLHHTHRHIHSPREAQHWAASEVPSRTALVERTLTHLVARTTCTDDDAPGCTKPTQIPTLPIVLGVVIPVVGAAICWIILHRRHMRKLKEEDAKDKYKSLDFGVDIAGSKGPKGSEMSMGATEKGAHHKHGISLDMGSPYIMPAGLNSSRESFHSLSRSMHDPNDPYRGVAMIKDDASIRSNSRSGRNPYDQGSLYTTRTTSSSNTDRMNNSLLKNAQRMSRSVPPRGESMSPDRETPEIRFPEPTAYPLSPLNPNSPSPPAVNTKAASEPQSDYFAFKPANAPAPESTSANVPANTPTAAPAPAPQAGSEPPLQEAKAPVQPTPSPPPTRIQSQAAVLQSHPNTASFMSDSSYGEGFKVTPPSPPRSPTREHARVMSEDGPLAPAPLHPQRNGPVGLGVEQSGYNANRLSIIGRPLPPDDPNDNPEQRANRIRSFYKEYFDDSKPEPAGGHVFHNDQPEDYASEYLDGSVFDPHSGGFVVAQPSAPFAQPVTRRAMTPPPRAPPRFRSGSNPRGPHMSNGSMASSHYMPPRNMSSMSNRGPPPGPRKPLPPPTPLASLPTPSMLKEDFMMINNPIDFAPPVTYRDRQNGLRPDSPLGAPRPFSPAVRPHTPLTSSFDDLAVMPSPHLLRKSGTFTALDFAPPPRFRDPGASGSDAGSIRSNRSGISTTANYAIRTGANRISRIPKGVVGTKEDLTAALRPQMSMVSSS